jgi:hypothetical protein
MLLPVSVLPESLRLPLPVLSLLLSELLLLPEPVLHLLHPV